MVAKVSMGERVTSSFALDSDVMWTVSGACHWIELGGV